MQVAASATRSDIGAPSADCWFARVAIAGRVLDELGGSRVVRHAAEPGRLDRDVGAGRRDVELLFAEARRRPWDFVHCSPGTRHAFVGTGDLPCVILMTGARTEGPDDPLPVVGPRPAHRAGVETETDSPVEAYAPLPAWGVAAGDLRRAALGVTRLGR